MDIKNRVLDEKSDKKIFFNAVNKFLNGIVTHSSLGFVCIRKQCSFQGSRLNKTKRLA